MLSFFAKKEQLMKNTDPDRIYVENVRSFFNMPYKVAYFFCEMAVKEGYFRKKIGLQCPNSNCRRIIKTVNNVNEIEPHVKCINCEINEEDCFDFPKEKIIKLEYYQLIR